MKKSTRYLSLLLMGSLTVPLAGCSSEPADEFTAYANPEECVNDGIFTTSECREMALAAIAENPQFNEKSECEQQFGEGNCQTVQSGNEAVAGERRSSWMPILAGYMIGRYMGAGGMMQGAQPLYRQPQGQQAGSGGFARSFRTLGGATVQADAKGKVANPSQSLKQGFTRTAKPYAGRTTGSRSGGFSGGRSAT